jgi:hypothetical protein
VFGADVTDAFYRASFDFFGDGALLQQQFYTGDILRPETLGAIPALHGGARLHVIYAGSVLHLFEREQTAALARNVHALLCENGGLFFGRTVGSGQSEPIDRYDKFAAAAAAAAAGGRAGEHDAAAADAPPSSSLKQLKFLHSVSSLTALLKDAGFDNVVVARDEAHIPLNSDSQPGRLASSVKAPPHGDALDPVQLLSEGRAAMGKLDGADSGEGTAMLVFAAQKKFAESK